MRYLIKLLFYRLPQNLAAIFARRNLLWHGLAIFLTFIIVTSGLDWKWFSAFHTAVPLWALLPAIGLLPLLAIFVPLVLYILGRVRKQAGVVNTAGALGQAALLGLLISDFYKAFTGRIPPEFMGADSTLTDISHGFRLGFMRGGIFWGWPSGHTTVAFALAVTLLMLFPKNKTARWLALIYAFYVGLSVSISIHWLSEFVAGAIIGSVIGVVVGKSFRERSTTHQ